MQYAMPLRFVMPLPLAYAFHNDNSKDVRTATVVSLGVLGTAGAKKILRLAMVDKSPMIRRKAAGALAFLRDLSAVEPLIKDMRDEDEEVRMNAAEDLGYLGGGNKAAFAPYLSR